MADLDLGSIIGIVIACAGLVIFILKALIYKTTKPLDDRVTKLESRMTIVEEYHPAILKAIQELPDTIDNKIKSREEYFDLKYASKEDLDKKQNKRSS